MKTESIMSENVKNRPNVEKKMRDWWKILQIGVILSELLFCLPVTGQQDAVSELRQQLLEARVALESFQERTRELEGQLAEKSDELERLQGRYAELLMAGDAAVDEMTRLEIGAAHLIAQAQDTEEMEADAATELLDTLNLTRRRLLELSAGLQRHRQSINAVLDACQPSQTLRQSVEDGLGELQNKLESCMQPLKLVREQQTEPSLRMSAAVLRVDATARLVVIDQGFLNGVRAGMTFALRREGAVSVRLKVIESRATCSAAMIEQGEFRSLVPGVLLQREAILGEKSEERTR